jgi:lysozyme
MRFKKTLAALEARDFDRAADEALDSLWARQTPNRAERIAAAIRKGE